MNALPRQQHRSRLLLTAFVALTALAAGGCSSIKPIKPWVKPYERERLADPIMAFDRNPSAQGFLEHVYEVRSAARGGTGASGGGCGCN